MGELRPEVSSASHAWDGFYGDGSQEPQRPEHPKGSAQADERVSHVLARILRYHAQSIGLQPDEEGWVRVSQMLQLQELALLGADEEDVRRVSTASVGARGPRFETRDKGEDGGLDIRAFYKHPPTFGFGDTGRGRSGYRNEGGAGRGYNGQRAHRNHYQDFDRRDDRRRDGDEPPRHARRGFSQGEPPESPGHSPRQDIPTRPISPARDATIPAWISRRDPERADEPLRDEPTKPVKESEASAAGPEVWEKYHEPKTQRAWFWNESTKEVFYADDESCGWERFEDPKGKPWWWHEGCGRYFVEEE